MGTEQNCTKCSMGTEHPIQEQITYENTIKLFTSVLMIRVENYLDIRFPIVNLLTV